MDRSGRRTPLMDDRRGFRIPAVSPDGRYVAVTIDPRPSQVWVYDLARRSGVPLATEGHSMSPLWMAGGRQVAYASNAGSREANGNIYVRPADGSAEARRLLLRDRWQHPASQSSDGRTLIFNDDHPTNRSDIWVLPVGGEPQPLIFTSASEDAPSLSPDGRWLAYTSDESGRHEVYVRPFPNVEDGKWVVSTGGGAVPVWSPSGRELFYMNGTAMMAVSVEADGATFSAGQPELLFTGPFETGSLRFDIFPDGASFAMVEADPDARPTQIHVVLNWTEELKRLAPLTR